ncbi:MAG: hypothetical protein EHM62_07345, partial [Methylococcus sp.]
MSSPVMLIGIDSLPPELFEKWMAQGEMPNLSRLRNQSTFAIQKNFSLYRTENSWLTFLQGCSAESSEEWGHQDYQVGDYATTERASYGFSKYPPFYALCQHLRVAVFDVPLTGLVENVNGLQVLGWGTEVNQCLRESSPPGLVGELIKRHGRHPVYDRVLKATDDSTTLNYRIPSIYDLKGLQELKERMIEAVGQRTEIILDLMRREAWDMMLCVYAEAHTALHLFWHLSQPHPLHESLAAQVHSDFLLEVVRAIDSGIGILLAEMPAKQHLLVFSPHGMQANTLDIYSMLFLPELLYRWSTGHAALCEGETGTPPPPLKLDYSRHWREEIWALRTRHGDAVLESPFQQEVRKDPLDWDPGNWYRSCWPRLRAFTLPGYSEGLVRINVAGRDGPGGIPAEQFDSVCTELITLLHELKDVHSGQPIVAQVLRIRANPDEKDASKPPADLMVCWREDVVTNVVEHHRHGRIGAAPYFRSGGHSTAGFVMARGPGFEAGSRLEDVDA